MRGRLRSCFSKRGRSLRCTITDSSLPHRNPWLPCKTALRCLIRQDCKNCCANTRTSFAHRCQTLPPQRDVEHEIETGDVLPVNTRAYPLSAQPLKEQARQIAELL